MKTFFASLTVVLLSLISGCESPRRFAPKYAPPPASPVPSAGVSREAGGADYAPKPTAAERPGLGTTWGEQRESWVSNTSFVRTWGDTPSAKDAIFYNDREGTEATLDYLGGSPKHTHGMSAMANGLVSVGIREGAGRWLDGWIAGGRRLVAGTQGSRYELVVKNETRRRIEVVMSVDGLDVLDGKSASFKKRGYILGPRETMENEGFRTSDATVAAFRFGSVAESYANVKHNNTRNVGVLGVAVFQERWPAWSRGPADAWERTHARPFPGSGNYSSPPDA